VTKACPREVAQRSGGVISPLVANLYMNRFLKYWRRTAKGEAWDAHIINYADEFVILCRGFPVG
jgi:RNA-directed DNA polymerase